MMSVMMQRLTHVTVIVRDQDEALRFYTEQLGMVVRDDRRMGEFRWLTVAPSQDSPVAIVLQKPSAPYQAPAEVEDMLARVGHGTMWVVETRDCRGTAEALKARGVKLTTEPEDMPWGVSAVFTDLYGNPYNLLQPAAR
jgi:predicted enzyme related to lactoylglutathione lyase